MLIQKKRHFKRNTKKSNQSFLIVLSMLIILMISGSFLFLLYFNSKRSYISPVSSVFGKSLNITEEVGGILESRKIHPLSIRIASEGAVIVLLENDSETIFSSSKPIEDQVSSLQRIESRLTIEGKAFKKIDFRFDNPVISFGEEESSL